MSPNYKINNDHGGNLKEAKGMFMAFFPDSNDFRDFWRKIKSKATITGSCLHSYFSLCYKDKSYMDNLEIINE